MKPSVSLRLIGESRTYEPGDSLLGEYFVEIADPQDVKAYEISVLWYTEGKGDEDLSVHHFRRQANDNGQFIDLRSTQQFKVELPNSPLSYDGVIVKIHWCTRVRVFLRRGTELVAEQSFRLGNVPRARPRRPAAASSESSESGRGREETGGSPTSS